MNQPYKDKVIIGDCTLYLGNSLDIMPTLATVDHIVSDPPYEESLHASKNKLRGRIRSDKGPDLQGLDFSSINEIRERVVSISYDICAGWFLAFCTVEGTWEWANEINKSKMKYKRACIWIKPDSTPQLNGQCPAQGYECFVTAWCGHGHSKWNSGGKRGVYTHCVNGGWRHGGHPTEKPIALMTELIFDFTNAGQTILDPFMGSGTTGVACVKTGRKFIGIELDRRYFDIACERIEKAYSQPDLFIQAPEKLVQQKLFEGENK